MAFSFKLNPTFNAMNTNNNFRALSACFATVFATASTLVAQSGMGLYGSDFLPTSSQFLNPATTADSKVWLQFNVVGTQVYADNNLVKLVDYKYADLLNATIPALTINTLIATRYVSADVAVDGPAFTLSQEKWGIGVFIRARAVGDLRFASGRTLLAYLSQTATNEDNIDLNLNNSRASAMGWLEYGFNYSRMISRDRKGVLTAGGNLRYAQGITYQGIQVAKLNGYYNDTIIQVDQLSGNVWQVAPALNAGRGAALDIGLRYKRTLSTANKYLANSVKCNCKPIDYKYIVGLSLRDMGFIRFNKNVTQTPFSGSGTYYTDRNDLSYEQDVEQLLASPSQLSSLTAAMPLNLTAQMDYNFQNGFFISGVAVKNLLPNNANGVRGANFMTLTGRFEIRDFGIALPITFQKYISPMAGLSLRFRGVAVGIDNITPLLHKTNLHGTGFYLKWSTSVYKNPACNRKRVVPDKCPGRNKKGQLTMRPLS